MCGVAHVKKNVWFLYGCPSHGFQARFQSTRWLVWMSSWVVWSSMCVWWVLFLQTAKLRFLFGKFCSHTDVESWFIITRKPPVLDPYFGVLPDTKENWCLFRAATPDNPFSVSKGRFTLYNLVLPPLLKREIASSFVVSSPSDQYVCMTTCHISLLITETLQGKCQHMYPVRLKRIQRACGRAAFFAFYPVIMQSSCF